MLLCLAVVDTPLTAQSLDGMWRSDGYGSFIEMVAGDAQGLGAILNDDGQASAPISVNDA